MSLLWMDSFDIYGDGATGNTNMLEGVYADITGIAAISTAQARTGANSFRFAQNVASFRRVFGADKTEVGVGYALYMESLPVAENARNTLAMFQDNAATGCVSLCVTTTGQIEVRTGSPTGTVVATSDPVLVTTAWQHVEMRVSIHATTGAVEVRVNGQTVINASNIDTRGSSTGITSQVRVGFTGAIGGIPPIWYVDDIYAWDTAGTYNNDFIGDKKVYFIVPNADTAVADWVPDAGTTGYTQIDEIPPVSTDYIQGNAVADESEFSMTNLPSDVTNILALQFYTKMLKTDAGDSNVQVAVVSGASSANGADRPLTTNATVYTDVFEEDPDTSAPWTLSGVDAILSRVTRTL